MKIVIKLVLVLFCLALPFSYQLGSAATSRALPAADVSGENYLPVVNQVRAPADVKLYHPTTFKNYCPGSAISPFTIQIAGLSDFSRPAGMSDKQVEQLRAQQYDELAASIPALVQALSVSGADWTRIYIDWSYIQPNDPAGGAPTYNWTYYDNVLQHIASSGLKIIATISGPPAWARVTTAAGAPCTNRIAAAKVTDFQNFVTAVVGRYKGSPYNIHVWELLNEPDANDGYRCDTGVSNYGQNGADYASVVTQTAPLIKGMDAEAKVIMGGVAYDWFYLPQVDPNGDGSPAGQFNRYFMDDVAVAGGVAALDAVNFHYFRDYHLEWERWTTGDSPTCGNNTLRDPTQPTYTAYGLDIMAKGSHFMNRLKTCYGVERPLWITEVGHHGMTDPSGSNPEWTLDNQARYVFTVYARSMALGAENITWYALKIIPSVTANDYQGLLYDSRDAGLENQPKPAFYAYQTLAGEMEGYVYSATIAGAANVEAYSFTNDCSGNKIVAWYNAASGTAPLVMAQTTSVRLVYRPLNDGTKHVETVTDGGAGDLDMAVNGSITIQLSQEPVIVVRNP